MLLVMALVVSGWTTSSGQAVDAEVPGDHFSLEGALELFKKSASPEEFEKMLNSPESKVNNLDLNGDGYIDYIRVIDRYEGNVHAFILQAVISEREYQDVAVIELEKLANGKAVLQIVGDADVYGVETIIEPTREVRTYAGTTSNRTIVNVWAWPSVQYVYGPYYDGWISPWGWYSHPIWWHSWRPVAYVHYHSIWRPYYHYYSPYHTHRVVYAHRIYHPHRMTSVVYHHRHRDQIDHYRSSYRDGDRSRRGRDDDRRSYDQGGRSSTADNYQRGRDDSNLSRRSSGQRELVTSQDRSATADRSVTPEIRRNGLRRSEAPTQRSISDPTNARQTRPTVTRPEVNRSRSSVPNVQQRSIETQRNAPAGVQRNSGQRYEAPARRSVDAPNSRETRPYMARPEVNRSRSSVPNVQQRSIETHRSAPANIQRSAPANMQRSAPSPRYEAPTRRSAPAQSAPPSVNRSRQSGGQGVQPRPSNSGGRSGGENRRGRQ
jgi:hypothetical protein